jgi:hypothetical protein
MFEQNRQREIFLCALAVYFAMSFSQLHATSPSWHVDSDISLHRILSALKKSMIETTRLEGDGSFAFALGN